MKHVALRGLVAAPFTAFRGDGSLNLPVIERQAEALARNGVGGAFVCGTTGEGLSMTVGERKQVMEGWRASAGTKLRLIAHIGHVGLEDCKELARHAEKIGADAFSCMAPCFYKPATVEDLVTFCARVAETAPEMPFYYYHIPSMTGVNFLMADFLAAASGKIPNLVGIKYTHDNLMDMLACLQMENGRFDIVFGRDEEMLGGLATGAKAFIGSTYNFAAPVYHRLMAAFAKGDLETARKEQLRSVELVRLLVGYGFMGAAKALMEMLDVEVGPPRLPHRTLSGEQKSKLKKDLERLGLFEWLK